MTKNAPVTEGAVKRSSETLVDPCPFYEAGPVKREFGRQVQPSIQAAAVGARLAVLPKHSVRLILQAIASVESATRHSPRRPWTEFSGRTPHPLEVVFARPKLRLQKARMFAEFPSHSRARRNGGGSHLFRANPSGSAPEAAIPRKPHAPGRVRILPCRLRQIEHWTLSIDHSPPPLARVICVICAICRSPSAVPLNRLTFSPL